MENSSGPRACVTSLCTGVHPRRCKALALMRTKHFWSRGLIPGIAGTGPLRSTQPSLSPRKTFKGAAAGRSSPQSSVSFCLSLIIDDCDLAAGRARCRRAQFHPGPISGTPKRKRPSTCSALVSALSVLVGAAQHAWRSSTRNQTPLPHLDSRSPPRIWASFGCLARQWDSLRQANPGEHWTRRQQRPQTFP